MGSGGAMSGGIPAASDCCDDLNFPAGFSGVTVSRELDLAWCEARMVCVEPAAEEVLWLSRSTCNGY